MRVWYDEFARWPITLPEIKVARGGITYTRPTPAETRAREAMEAMIRRHVGDTLAAQRKVIDDACYTALANGWDVHVHRHPHKATRFIGIAFTSRDHIIPTIHEHRTVGYDDDWEDDH